MIVDFQKAFVTADYNILFKKLGCCGVRQISSKWFVYCLDCRKQFISLNEYNLKLHDVKYGMPQAPILEHLLFLLYINYLM